MCTNPASFQDGVDSFLYSKREVLARLEGWKKKYLADKENINLTGGEPTIHPDFLSLVSEVRQMFPENKIVMATNGRMFSYPLFAKKYLALNNLSLEVALHGHNARLHDAVTGVKGSFEQTVKGIRNILKYRNKSHELELRIVITKMNYRSVGKIVAFIKKDFSRADRLVLIFMEMEGLVESNFKKVGLTHRVFNSFLSSAKLRNWAKGLNEIRLYHFPLCTLQPELWPYVWRTLRGNEVVFLPRCKKCLYRKYCLGIHRDYLKLVGVKEFRPIRKKIGLKLRDSFYHPIVKVLD